MKKFDQVNVVPFIDIMLVLLAIVLTTASFVSQGLIKVNLPEASNTKVIADQGESKVVKISINKDEKFFINDKEFDISLLDSKLKDLNKDQLIILRVDSSVPFKHFVVMADHFKKYDLTNISILTKKIN